MILALEGPDCSGKTTLWEALKAHVLDAVFVPRIVISRELLPFMTLVQKREADLWEALYDRSKLYVCDRHFSITSWVYDKLYNREMLNYDKWCSVVRVVHLSVPLEDLQKRFAARGDDAMDIENLKRAKQLYEERVLAFRCISLTEMSVEESVTAILRWMR